MTLGYLKVVKGHLKVSFVCFRKIRQTQLQTSSFTPKQGQPGLLFQELNTLNTLPKVKPIPESLSSSGMTER